MTHYDVIIIGTGAGGGTLAYHLAPSGKKILLLERGDYVRREKDNWSSRAVNVEAKYHTKEVWRDRDGKPLHPHTNYYVGGNTKFYGAALFRLRKEDFGAIEHHGGRSPAWPIGYDELEPYYTRAEYLYQVHGDRGADPTEPWASAPYRFPAVRHEPRIQQLHDDLAARGLRPFHVPLGIMLDEANPSRSHCIRCETCDGYPCLVHAKSDAQVLCVDPALEHANVSLLTNARVIRLLTSPSGREISGVAVARGSKEEIFTADVVVSSCGAINSAALLLRSANDRHPNGLANSSDVVGRHYMGHVLRRQARRGRPVGGRPGDCPGHDAGAHGSTFARFLADLRGSARSGQSRDPRSRREHRAQLSTEQRRGTPAPDQAARGAPPASGHAPTSGAA
jgi:choline dehydrogenase-like flavoprotein